MGSSATASPSFKVMKTVTNIVELVLILVLTALAIVLHIYQWPFPLAPFLKFDLAGVPIAIIALIDMRYTLISAPIFWLGSVLLTSDPTKVVGPTMKIVAEIATALPLAATIQILSRRGASAKTSSIIAFASALICRVGLMSLLNYLVTPYWLVWAGWVKSLEAGYSFTVAYLPFIALFNAIIVCYVAPLSISIWASLKRLRII
ncbi:MAG: hypothetical protein QXN42_07910 [Ignisphaera sp.]